MHLSKFGLLSNFKYKKINEFISFAIDTFILSGINEYEKNQKLFFKYILQIYTNCLCLIDYLQDSYIQIFIDIFNNESKYSEDCIFLISIIMQNYENKNIIKLFQIIQELNLDYCLQLIELDNSNIVNPLLNIFSISIRNLPNIFIDFSKKLWEKIVHIFCEFKLKTKSLALNCLAQILNPKIKLSNDVIFDLNIYQIIIDHLQLHILDDDINLLFILQSFICMTINTNQEQELAILLDKNGIKDILEVVI